MLTAVNGVTEGYLNSLGRIQSAMTLVQQQVSSGVRVGHPSDDPSAVPAILESVARIALFNQHLANMNDLRVELEAGDASLQQALKLLDQAGAVASEGVSASTGNPKLVTLAAQARDIQAHLVDLS